VKTRNTQSWSTHYGCATLTDDFKITSNVIFCKVSENEFKKFLHGGTIIEHYTRNETNLQSLTKSEVPVIITIGNCLPGFDIFIMDRDNENELAITLVQTKFSKLKSTTTYNNTDIEESLKHMREMFKYYVKDYGNLLLFNEPNINRPPQCETLYFGNEKQLVSKNFRAVFILFAKTSGTLESKNNVCVINRDQLLNVYGPTIYNLIRNINLTS